MYAFILKASSEVPHIINDVSTSTVASVSDSEAAIDLVNAKDSLVLPSNWSLTHESNQQLRFCKTITSSESSPSIISHCLIVKHDGMWELFLYSKVIDVGTCSVLDPFENRLTLEALRSLILLLDSCVICSGHLEEHFCDFVRSKKGQLTGRNNRVVAVLDSSVTVEIDGKIHHETVRSPYCQLLTQATRCSVCKSSRALIRAAYNRWSKPKSPSATSAQSKVKISSLTTPLRNKRIHSLRQQIKSDTRRIKTLKAKLDHIIKSKGVVVDEELENELTSIMKDKTDTIRTNYPQDSFHRILWEQQLQVSQKANKRNVRWHPAVIRWCLYLKSISSSAYNAIRSSGFLTLPSDRTLPDYMHYTKSGVGFLPEVHC